MTIKQFNDKALAHYSYALVSEGKMAIIDPSRNPLPYYQYAEEMDAKIEAVFETHPHADFVSSHLQMHQETGATIYVSKLLGADYPHQSFDEGDHFKVGDVIFAARNTPGHSPDSICILATEGQEKALFTGDTLFIGDVGRPDLRENVGNMKAKREELAKAMYQSLQNKFSDLADDVVVYPAHGAGSLCGKNLSSAASSTLGKERISNWAFQQQTEEKFITELLQDQPMIPHYFGFNVDTNKQGAEIFSKSIGEVPVIFGVSEIEEETIIIDTRSPDAFKSNHLPGSYNIPGNREEKKLETWLGAIVKPNENFYVVVSSVNDINSILERIAKIGYEGFIEAIITVQENGATSEKLDFVKFKEHPENYTIIDVRNAPELTEKRAFKSALNIPLHELRERTKEIPTDKPIVVHCASGYRSAAGSSIIARALHKMHVYDLSDNIKKFMA